MLPVTEELRRRFVNEHYALEEFAKLCHGLSCRVDPELLIRARQPDWFTWRRVRTLWYSVSDRPRATRVAVGLQPEDLVALHCTEHTLDSTTFVRGWSRRPMVEAVLRCLLVAIHENSTPLDPFGAVKPSATKSRAALALHYSGLWELKSATVLRCEAQGSFNNQDASIFKGGQLPKLVALLKGIDHMLSDKLTPTDFRKCAIPSQLFSALAIALACGCLHSRSVAAERQIQRLQAYVPLPFRVESITSIPEISLDKHIVPVAAAFSESGENSRKLAVLDRVAARGSPMDRSL
jgi:hypothetical protein